MKIMSSYDLGMLAPPDILFVLRDLWWLFPWVPYATWQQWAGERERGTKLLVHGRKIRGEKRHWITFDWKQTIWAGVIAYFALFGLHKHPQRVRFLLMPLDDSETEGVLLSEPERLVDYLKRMDLQVGIRVYASSKMRARADIERRNIAADVQYDVLCSRISHLETDFITWWTDKSGMEQPCLFLLSVPAIEAEVHRRLNERL